MNELTETQQVPVVNPKPAPRPSRAFAVAPGGGINLVNNTKFPAEFRVLQGSMQVARVGIAPGAQAWVPQGHSYTVQAVTTMGEVELTSQPLSFDARATCLLAQMAMEQPGLYDFRLVQLAATQPNAIVCENTWREPVVFKFTRDGSPLDIVMVADEHDAVEVSTAQQWTVYAIINGITTQSVQTNNPNAVITAVQDPHDDGFSLTVS